MRTRSSAIERWSGYGVVFGVGFAGLTTQSLLFRKFLSVFEGHELGIAVFFGSWLLWVAVGAWMARSRRLGAGFIRRFEFLPLAYIPAYLIQSWLIVSARELAGVRGYEVFPLLRMVGFLVPANAPVSVCTGILFTSACAWMGKRVDATVSRVYIAESVGSAVGGVALTVLLARGTAAETVFLVSAGVVAFSIAVSRLSRGARPWAFVPAALVVAAATMGIGGAWTRALDVRRWERLLPREAYRGSFTTPQARYLYGEHRGQFNIVAWESIAETLPGTESASRIIAIHLAQHPTARRFLVAGPGSFPLCRRLLDLPQAESVTWLDPDPAYPARLLEVLPRRYRAGTERLTVPGADIRRHLSSGQPSFDVVILNLPDVSTLTLNRYFTREFFELTRRRLADSGVVGIRIAGGENFMGDEVVNAGAAVFHTLRSTFAHVAIKPGDETWLLASDRDDLSASPAVLRDRFAAVAGAAALYPPDALLSLYLPDRIEFQLRSYAAAAERVPEALLLNTDRRPKSLLHGLLRAARQAGAGAGLLQAIRSFAARGAGVLPLALAVFAILRVLYLWRRPRSAGVSTGGRANVFGAGLLVGSTGMVGMTVSITLMFLYQSLFGSLFLHVGLVSALFMCGLSAGGLLSQFLVARSASGPGRVAAWGLCLHALLMGALCAAPGAMGHGAFALLFVLAGIGGGLYVPVAGSLLREAGLTEARAGGAIDACDHVGGAMGAMGAGIALLPLFGARYALGVMAALLLVNLPTFLIGRRVEATDHTGRFARRVCRGGYVLFGTAAVCLGAALILAGGRTGAGLMAYRAAARNMAGPLVIEERTCEPVDGAPYPYFILREEGGATNSWVCISSYAAPQVMGYAGPVTLAMRLAPEGALLDLRIVDSRETPAYLDSLAPWLHGLAGRRLFEADALADIDAVTGATLTSAAVLQTLQLSGRVFGEQVFGRAAATSAPSVPRRPDWRLTGLAILAVAAVALRFRPSRRRRWWFLAATLLVSGLWLNAQFSLTHILSLIGMQPPPIGWNAAFLLVAGVPLLVALFGNIYCGYLCPFGALQELIGRLRPASWRTDPAASAWQRGRTVKYVLLAGIVILFAVKLDTGLASPDPLVTAFARRRTAVAAAGGTGLLVLAFVYGRFWCRTLCPAGAFLALFNRLRLLRRFVPPVNYRRCVYGVTGAGELDCICCDRCRLTSDAERAALAAARSRATGRGRGHIFLLLVAALSLALFWRMAAVSQRGETDAAAGPLRAPAGAMRRVDMPRLRGLIEEGRLSDREAMHYSPAAAPDAP